MFDLFTAYDRVDKTVSGEDKTGSEWCCRNDGSLVTGELDEPKVGAR